MQADAATLSRITMHLAADHPDWSPSKCTREARRLVKHSRSSPAARASMNADHEFGRPLDYLDPTGEEAVWRQLKKARLTQ